MILFEELGFNFAPDSDYHNYSNIITFAVGDIEHYRFEGNTHGIVSHALKHLSEFDKPFVIGIVNEIREDMYNYAKLQQEYRDKGEKGKLYDPYYKLAYYNKRIESKISVEDIQDYTVVHNSAILNYLDLINDDVILGKRLPPFADYLQDEYFPRIKERYSQACEYYMRGAKELDGIRNVSDIVDILDNGDTVKFTAIYGKFPIKVYLNLKKQGMIIVGQNGKVNSAYRFSKAGREKSHDRIVHLNYDEMIRLVLLDKGKRWQYRNPIVRDAFKKFVEV